MRKVTWWQWLLIAGAVAGLMAGGVLSNRLHSAGYTSAAQVLMTGQGDPAQPNTAYESNQYVNQRMSTYAQIATSAQVTAPAAQSVGTDVATLTSQITATVTGDTTVLALQVAGATPEAAHRSAVAVTQSFVGAITKLEANRVVVNVITDPTSPAIRSLPGLWLFLLGGLVAGLVLAVVAVFALRWLYPKRFLA